MNRVLLFLSLAGTVAAGVAAPAPGASPRPNFLFVLCDDQRYDALGVVQREQGGRGRFPWFKTPNMDRLAAEGVRFRNTFVTSSLCSPSRASILTGCYNHLNGVVNNHTPFPVNSVTFATVLRAAGYKTGYIGKWHMGQQHGQRPGFDFSASFIGQGQYNDCPFEINGVAQPTKGWVDDVSTEYAIDFMKNNRATPFALVVGFKSPHDPRTPPPRWQNAFAGETCRPPVSRDARPPYLQGRGNVAADNAVAAGKPDPRLNYFRCIAAADEDLGRLLAALDQLGLAENTMVICSSDNGYYLGEHGLGDKRSAYEESIRVPMLLRFPKLGSEGVALDQPILNIDLAPTLIDFAGQPVPATMQGRSWRPLLEHGGGAAQPSWRTAFFYEYFFERRFAVPTMFGVRTESAKLVEYPGHDDWTQVFDLKADVYKMHNLAGDQTLRGPLQTELDRQKKLTGFRIPEGADKPEAQSAPGVP